MGISAPKSRRLFLAVVGFFAVVACGFALWKARIVQGGPPGVKSAITPALFKLGEETYQAQCAGCHGSLGQGNGPAAYLLYPKPRDFSRGEFRLISTRNYTPTDRDLFKTISRGMPGSAMPPWDFLPEKTRWALVYYVRYLVGLGAEQRTRKINAQQIQAGPDWETRKRFMKEGIAPEDIIQIAQEPPRDEQSVQRGRELFLVGCASCHGQEGRGDGPAIMKDTVGMPIQARDLTSGLFKGSSASEDLYYRMIGGLPGAPMPSYQEAFKEDQIWDLIHYVQTLPRPGVEERCRLKQHALKVSKTSGEIPTDPAAGIWDSVQPEAIALMPLWWRNERVEEVRIKAIHNGKDLALHLEWPDATQDAKTIAPQQFSDGAAVQLASGENPPFFAMGSANAPVHLWNWKASWQEDQKSWRDIEKEYPNTNVDWYPAQKTYRHGDPFEMRDAKTASQDPRFMSGWGAGNSLSNPGARTAAEEGMAKGIGTFTTQHPKIERVNAQAVWKDGKWQLVFVRPLKTSDKDALVLKPGRQTNVAFAVWDGAHQDRNGQKMISIWNTLILEK